MPGLAQTASALAVASRAFLCDQTASCHDKDVPVINQAIGDIDCIIN